MDALTLITLALFALMVIAWAVLPSTAQEATHAEVDAHGAVAPAAAAQ